MGSACLRGGECLEAPEPGKQEVGPGVVGLVAQDGAAGMAGDDGGDGHQPQPDRPGLPGAGGGASGLMLLLCVKGGEVLVVAVCELG